MVSIDTIHQNIQAGITVEYRNDRPLDIFDSAECLALATQAIAHRHLKVNGAMLSDLRQEGNAIPVILVEDDYPGWLRSQDLSSLERTDDCYQPRPMGRESIASVLADVVKFAIEAMAIPNEYLWGGTIGPHLDCSGLVQRAYGSQGIWVPRDAYQQEAFTQVLTVNFDEPESLDLVLMMGDLIFFGSPQKATHVAIYLGQGQYIHSSGKEQGRNCIGLDSLIQLSHPVSQTYFEQYRGAGRVMTSFCP